VPAAKRSRNTTKPSTAARREARAFLIRKRDRRYLRLQVGDRERPLEWADRKSAAPFPSYEAADTFIRAHLDAVRRLLGVQVVPA
jgi:hypothetical protein